MLTLTYDNCKNFFFTFSNSNIQNILLTICLSFFKFQSPFSHTTFIHALIRKQKVNEPLAAHVDLSSEKQKEREQRRN